MARCEPVWPWRFFAYAGAVACVGAVLSWKLDPVHARTQRLLAAALPRGTCAAIACTFLFAWTQSFGTTAAVVLADVVVAMIVFALFVVGVRVLAVRRERQLEASDDVAPSATPPG